LKGSVTEEDIKNALSFYGKVVNCTLNPSKKAGILNAVATFSDE
jgi:predicted enzyme related to lactoylglutathione lyase